jgi:hypothetical protein
MISIDRSARVFLGLTTAGIFPGFIFFLSLWFKRTEQAFRVTMMFLVVMPAGAFGFLDLAIQKLEGKAGLHGWAWIVSIDISLPYKRTDTLFSSSLKVSSQFSWPL